jgi:hypothetical protein
MFHKQKTTKITLNFPKIIEMHLNSSSQCIQLAMRQVNKREKKTITAKRETENHSRSLWDSNSRHSPSVVPLRHHVLHGKYVNLLYIYILFLASAIYDCVPLYTAKGTVATEPYLLFNPILTIHHGIDHGYQPGLFNCNTILQCNTPVSRAYR